MFKKETYCCFFNWNKEGRKNTNQGDNDSLTGGLFWQRFGFDGWGSVSKHLDTNMHFFQQKKLRKASLRNMLHMHQLTGYKILIH